MDEYLNKEGTDNLVLEIFNTFVLKSELPLKIISVEDYLALEEKEAIFYVVLENGSIRYVTIGNYLITDSSIGEIGLLLDRLNNEVLGVSVSGKADYLQETITILKYLIRNRGVNIEDSDTFRSYIDKLSLFEYFLEGYLDKTSPVPSVGGVRILHILSNDSWTITKPEWLECSEESGTGSLQVTLTFPKDYDRQDYTNLILTGTNSRKTFEISIMNDNYPLIFETDGLAEELYKVSGQIYTTELNKTYYRHNFGLEDEVSIDLSPLSHCTKIYNSPVLGLGILPCTSGSFNNNINRALTLTYINADNFKGYWWNNGYGTGLMSVQSNNVRTIHLDKFPTTYSNLPTREVNLNRYCSYLNSLEEFIVDNPQFSVTAIVAMFSYCINLEYIDLSNWDFSTVILMNQMFNGCTKLKSLNTSVLNTVLAESLSNLFLNCSNLEEVPSLDTTMCTSMYETYSGCTKLTYIPEFTGTMDKVTTFGKIFCNCKHLKHIPTINVTDKCINLEYVVQGCSDLEELDISNWNTSNVTNFNYAFSGLNCSITGLENLLVTDKCTTMSSMFYNSKLTSIDVSNWNTSNVKYMDMAFKENTYLEELDVSNWNLSSLVSYSGTNVQGFVSNTKVKRLNFNGTPPIKLTKCSNIITCSFYLEHVTFKDWDFSNLENDLILCSNSNSALVTIDGGFHGIKRNCTVTAAPYLSLETVDNLINALEDLSGETGKTIYLHTQVKNRMTDLLKSAIIAKNWTLA